MHFMTQGPLVTFPESLSWSRGQKSACSGWERDWEVSRLGTGKLWPSLGLCLFLYMKLYRKPVGPSQCLSATTRAAAAAWSRCHRNHVVCKQNMFTLWPFAESSPALALEKSPELSRTSAFLDNFCICGEVTEKIMPLPSPSRTDPG